MKKKNFTKMFAVAAIAAASVSNSFAQDNIGADCGCPAFSARTTVVDLASLAVNGGVNDGDLIATNTVLTCDKKYLLNKKIYVPDGKSITIAPGTVILGADVNDPVIGGNASALIVSRGGQIIAAGTATCPIVFTSDQDDMTGTYSISNRGKWGGLVILGKGINNVRVGQTLAGLVDGEAFIEGYLNSTTRNIHGMPLGQGDNTDNSGILRYVSIRHAGDILGTTTAGNELNGLSLGSVGSGTTIDHVEVVSSDDDGIEIFGGAVNLKYISMLYGNDDMLDYDLGWVGKAQFVFGLKADAATTPCADNGIEADGDDNKSNVLPLSNPQIYNVTMISNGSTTINCDNSGKAAIKNKEKVEGSTYNSVFMNFRNGLDLIKSTGTRTGGVESYHNWINGAMKVGCNTFIENVQNGFSIANAQTAVIGSDNTKFGTDNNVSINTAAATALTLDFTFAITNTPTPNNVTNQYDAVPNANIVLGALACTPPADGFFSPALYRGAFEAGKKSWLADWSYLNLVKTTQGLVPCPTDCNQDGKTDNADFIDLLGEFNQNCD
jgi:hypothetical protein